MNVKINYKEIIKLIDLLEERNLSHFELEVEGFKIKISRSQPHASSAENLSAPPLSTEHEEKRLIPFFIVTSIEKLYIYLKIMKVWHRLTFFSNVIKVLLIFQLR